MRQFSGFLRDISLLAMTAASWVGRPAHACSPAPCLPPLAFPSIHATLPANLVAFPVLAPANVDSLILRVRGGEVVPASVKMVGPDRVFAPDVPLAPNQSYEVIHACTRPQEEPQPFVFTTSDPVSLAVGSGELVIEEEGIANPGSASNEGVFARVRFYAGNQLGIAGPVFSTPSVDGREVPWDAVKLANGSFVVPLMARCSPVSTDFEVNTCGGVFAVPARKVKLAVKSHLVGSPQDPPPATLEVDLRCDRSFTPTRPAPLNPRTPDMGTPTSPPSAGGCAYLPAGSRSPLASLAGALGLALLAARRRRR